MWIAIAIFGTFFLWALVSNIPNTLTRVALGLVLAFALDPVVRRLRSRFGLSRGTSVAIVSTAAILLFALLLAVVGPQAIHQATKFSSEVPETVDKLSQLPIIGDLLDRVDASERLRSWASDLPNKFSNQAIADLTEALIGGVAAAITVLIVGIAVLADGETLVARGRQLIPSAHREAAVLVGRVFYRTIGAYFAGSLVVAALASTFVLTVGLALQVPLAPVAALWVLIVNLIPQVGGLLGASFFTLLALTRSPGTAVLCLVLYLVYMNIENHVIQPAIIGSAVNLSAAATMLAALVGGAAAGVPGAIIATPLVATAKALYLETKGGGIDHGAATKRQSPFAAIFGRIKNRFKRSSSK